MLTGYILPATLARQYAWIEKGKEFEQPTVSGRDRVNIIGMINAEDVLDISALDCAGVNAESAKERYQKALEKHPEAPKNMNHLR